MNQDTNIKSLERFKLAIIKGAKQGLKTTWMLGKVIVPVYLLVAVLKLTPVIGWINILFEPIMQLFGLPGETSIILVLGNLINIYAALGAMATFKLTGGQITVLAVMLSFSHTLLIETAVTKRIGLKALPVVALRMGMALLFGFITAQIVA